MSGTELPEDSVTFPRSMWIEEVCAGDTILGYFDWVSHMTESELYDKTGGY